VSNPQTSKEEKAKTLMAGKEDKKDVSKAPSESQKRFRGWEKDALEKEISKWERKDPKS